jgi:hypothetical protein
MLGSASPQIVQFPEPHAAVLVHSITVGLAKLMRNLYPQAMRYSVKAAAHAMLPSSIGAAAEMIVSRIRKVAA